MRTQNKCEEFKANFIICHSNKFFSISVILPKKKKKDNGKYVVSPLQ